MTNTERVAYVNGEIVPESRAVVSIRDRGFLQGDAVFDTTRTFRHEIFRLEEHLDRFFNSLKYMRIDPGLSKREFADVTMQVLNANLPLLTEDEDYWVSQRVTRGVMTDGEYRPTVVIECAPLPFEARANYYREGMPVIVPSVRRTPPDSHSPRAKVHNYVNLVQAELEVKAQNPDGWPILLDTNGNLAEGPGSNIFIVKDGALMTPREQFVLAGISRRVTIELAEELGITVHEADIDLFRRLHRGRGVRHLHQLLHLPGIVRQRLAHSGRRRPRPGHRPPDPRVQRPGRHGRSRPIPVPPGRIRQERLGAVRRAAGENIMPKPVLSD